jgi:hypothetical protein
MRQLPTRRQGRPQNKPAFCKRVYGYIPVRSKARPGVLGLNDKTPHYPKPPITSLSFNRHPEVFIAILAFGCLSGKQSI